MLHLEEAGIDAFILSSSSNSKSLPEAALDLPLTFLNSDDPTNLRFATLLNIANGVAYGGVMGMPAWVMVDCALLPGMFVGVRGPARLIPPETRRKMDTALASYLNSEDPSLSTRLEHAGMPDISGPLRDEELVPLAEFCAVPAIAPGDIIGFSLYSLRPGLGTLAKALGLAVYAKMGAAMQIGVAQYDSRALRTHTRFGDLKIRQVLTALHTKADSTFIYEMPIPTATRLQEIVSNLRGDVASEGATPHRPDDWARLREMDSRNRAGTHRYRITAPGYDPKQNVVYVIEERLE